MQTKCCQGRRFACAWPSSKTDSGDRKLAPINIFPLFGRSNHRIFNETLFALYRHVIAVVFAFTFSSLWGWARLSFHSLFCSLNGLVPWCLSWITLINVWWSVLPLLIFRLWRRALLQLTLISHWDWSYILIFQINLLLGLPPLLFWSYLRWRLLFAQPLFHLFDFPFHSGILRIELPGLISTKCNC